MRGLALLAVLALLVLSHAAFALEEGDRLTYRVVEAGGEALVTFRVVDPAGGVVVVESREVKGGGGIVILSLEPGARLGPPDPWTPEEACTSFYPLAPGGYTGTVEERGMGYSWSCTYRDGVLVELAYEELGYRVEMSLEQGPGDVGKALAVLATLLMAAAIGLLWLYRKARSM